MGVYQNPVPVVPCVPDGVQVLVLCASTDGRPIRSVDGGVSWTELDGTAIADGATPVACGAVTGVCETC